MNAPVSNAARPNVPRSPAPARHGGGARTEAQRPLLKPSTGPAHGAQGPAIQLGSAMSVHFDRVRRPACRRWRGLGLCALIGVSHAQTHAQAPDAGAVLREIRPAPAVPAPNVQAPAPLAPAPAPSAAPRPAAPSGIRVEVQRFRIEGLPAASAEALQPLLAPFAGAGKTLEDLVAAAKAVEDELRRRGLFLAQVLVPEQTLAGGVVGLQVFEGRFGDVNVVMKPGAIVSPALVDAFVEPLRGHPLIERELVEGALLRLGDLRGVAVRSALKPGAEPGTADITIEVEPGVSHAVSVEYDNGGSVPTGRNRYYVTLAGFNLAGRGDTAMLRAQASSGTRFLYGSWWLPVNGAGTQLGVAASVLGYELGTAAFEPLDAQGRASSLALQARHPLLRSRDHDLYVQASLESRRFVDEVRASGLKNAKRLDGYVSASLNGERRGASGGIDRYALALASGRLRLEDGAEAALDAQGYRSAGRYAKLSLSASHLQTLWTQDSLLLTAQAQLASRNLDSAEKFSLGGSGGVRGYPASESPSDQALTFGWEWRRLLGEALDGRWTASLFGDYGAGWLHKSPLATDGDNTRRLAAHGFGLSYGNGNGLAVQAFVAWRGHTPAQSDDSRSRLLVQASLSF